MVNVAASMYISCQIYNIDSVAAIQRCLKASGTIQEHSGRGCYQSYNSKTSKIRTPASYFKFNFRPIGFGENDLSMDY